MFKRKYLVILLFLIICICAISTVSAADLNATDDVIGEEASDEIAISDESSDELEYSNEDVLEVSKGSFTDFNKLIDKYEVINLERDYQFSKSDEVCIVFDKDTVVYGNEHEVNGKGEAIFIIEKGCHVEIYDLKLTNDANKKPEYKFGGAIENHGDLYLENCFFEDCSSANKGGAIYNDGNMDVNQCIFIGNKVYDKTEGEGGAIASCGKLWVNSSYFGNNSAAFGGAISSWGQAWIQDSFFGNYENITGPNRAKTGSAIYNHPNKGCDVDSSSFINNIVESGGEGGAVTNVISTYCHFEKSPILRGVIYDCEVVNSNMNNVIQSTGFEFSTSATSIDTYYNGENLKVTVTSNPNGEPVSGVRILLKVDGSEKIITTNSNGVATYSASTLTPGNHNIVVSLYDDLFNEKKITIPVKVKKVKASIKVSKVTTTYKSGKNMVITLKDNNNKPIANMKVTLKVFTGSKSKTYTVNTNSNGKASFKASTMKKGYHKVVLSVSHKGYTVKSVTSSIKVNAATLKYKYERISLAYGGGISVAVKHGTTNKYINGVKILVKVYTGSKYKTFSLYTGYDDDENQNGVIGLFTNKLSAGTHKVVISPADSKNFKGTLKTTIKIPKSAKNYEKQTIEFSSGMIFEY